MQSHTGTRRRLVADDEIPKFDFFVCSCVHVRKADPTPNADPHRAGRSWIYFVVTDVCTASSSKRRV